MRKFLFTLIASVFIGLSISRADTITPNLNLVEPTYMSQGWWEKTNSNWSTIDSNVPVLRLNNVFLGQNSFLGAVYYPNLGINSCLQTNSAGQVVGTGSTCGSGGGTISDVIAGYGLSGGGTAGPVTISLITNTTSYIQNTNLLQGATFYVSSATIAGQLSYGSLSPPITPSSLGVLTTSSATATYLQLSSATATYQPFGSYLTTSSATATYLQLSSATATYQPIGSYLTGITADYPLSGSGTTGSHLVYTSTVTASSLGALTAITADYPLSGSGTSGSHLVYTSTITLASLGALSNASVVTAGTYGSATISPTITFNAQGQIIAASSNTITGGSGSSVYPATATASFPLGFSASTATITNATVTYNLTAGSTTFNGQTYFWPNGSGAATNYLGTDGSGNLTWNAGTSGTISNVYNSTATAGFPLGVQVSTITSYGPGGSTYNNEVYGAGAGEKLTSGADNVYLGYQAGNAATTNGKSVYIGYEAGLKATTGASAENVFIGYEAGNAVTTQTDDVFIGYEAGLKATTSSSAGENTAVGWSSLSSMTTAEYNTAIGYGTLQFETGNSNTALGYYALNLATSGVGNTAVGYESIYGNTVTGQYNTATGYSSEGGILGGNGNSGFGYAALDFVNSGNYNSALGYGAGWNSVNSSSATTTGSFNTFLGYNSSAWGSYAPSLSSSTCLGSYCIVSSSNSVVIGWIPSVNGAPAVSNNVGIGTPSPATLLHISSGTVTIDGNVSPAITIKGSGAPPDNEALCLLNGQLGHCTGGTLVSCSCSVP